LSYSAGSVEIKVKLDPFPDSWPAVAKTQQPTGKQHLVELEPLIQRISRKLFSVSLCSILHWNESNFLHQYLILSELHRLFPIQVRIRMARLREMRPQVPRPCSNPLTKELVFEQTQLNVR